MKMLTQEQLDQLELLMFRWDKGEFSHLGTSMRGQTRGFYGLLCEVFPELPKREEDIAGYVAKSTSKMSVLARYNRTIEGIE